MTEEVTCHPHGWSLTPNCTSMFLSFKQLHLTFQKFSNTAAFVSYCRKVCRHWVLFNAAFPSVCFIFLSFYLELTCSLSVMEHGSFYPVKKTYEEGDVVQFFCQESYSFSGSDLIQCYSFGWYPEPPLCEGNSVIVMFMRPSPRLWCPLVPVPRAYYLTIRPKIWVDSQVKMKHLLACIHLLHQILNKMNYKKRITFNLCVNYAKKNGLVKM